MPPRSSLALCCLLLGRTSVSSPDAGLRNTAWSPDGLRYVQSERDVVLGSALRMVRAITMHTSPGSGSVTVGIVKTVMATRVEWRALAGDAIRAPGRPRRQRAVLRRSRERALVRVGYARTVQVPPG